MSIITWRPWFRGAIPAAKTLKSAPVMVQYPLPAKLRKDLFAVGVEGKVADPVTGLPAAVRIAEGFWPSDSFNNEVF